MRKMFGIAEVVGSNGNIQSIWSIHVLLDTNEDERLIEKRG
jgi:hypothetical protein